MECSLFYKNPIFWIEHKKNYQKTIKKYVYAQTAQTQRQKYDLIDKLHVTEYVLERLRERAAIAHITY